MNLKRVLTAAALSVLVSAAHHTSAASMLADYGPGAVSIPCGNCGDIQGTTFGWAFGVTDAITINGLGLWDAGADGIGPDVMAGLWVDGGALIASATITSSSYLEPSASTAGGWRTETIAPYVLGPGNYVIGAVGYNASTIQQAPFNTISSVFLPASPSRRGSVLPDSGFQRPDVGFDGPLTGYPNLRVVDAVVPVPATLLLVVSGVLLLLRRKTLAP